MNTGIRIPSPDRKRPRRPRATKNRKRKDKHHDLRPTIKRSRHNIIILDKELWTLPSQIPLGEETQKEKDADRRVDADEQVAHLPEDDGEVDVAERWMREVAVEDVEGERDDEAEEVGDGDPLVFGADGEGIFCD